MSNKTKITLIGTLIFTSIVYADHSEAKELFDDAKCMECHNNEDFKPRENKVNNFDKLHKAVKRCAYNNSISWFDDETLDVVKYLNKEFYHFKEPNLSK